MTLVLRQPTAIVRSCNSFGLNHPNYETWAKAGFTTFAFRHDDPFLDTALAAAHDAGASDIVIVPFKGETADGFVTKVKNARSEFPPRATVLELEYEGGLMPSGMQAGVFAALRKAVGSEAIAPLAIFVPPLKDEIDYGAAVDNGFFIVVESYGRQNDAVVPPIRCVGRVMTWYNEAAGRMQGVGSRRIVVAVSAGQAAYFKPKLSGTGTHGLFYWTADDDQGAVDAGKYLSLFGPQPEKEYVAWT